MRDAKHLPWAARTWALVLGAAALLGACGEERTPEPPRTARYDAEGRILGPRPAEARRPNLILIVVDTLRADALGADGAGRARMPWLQSLAERGTRFTEAAACAPWTLPSMTSLLTGLPTHVHGVAGESGMPEFPAAFTTFAEILRASYGYSTAAFVGGPWPGGETSMLAGFSHVVPLFALQGLDPLVFPWVRDLDRTKPFFLLLHTFEVHHPYGAVNHPFPHPPANRDPGAPDPVAALGPTPAARDLAVMLLTRFDGNEALIHRHPDLYATEVLPFLWRGLKDAPDEALSADLAAAYWKGARWVDDLLRRAAGRLREWGLLEGTVLAVTGDHGEAFGEHGILAHGRDCHDELLRVPLVVDGPGFQGGKRVAGSLSLADVLPTFMDAARVPRPEGIAGRSALPLLREGGPGRPVESEEWITPAKTGGAGPFYVATLRTARWKVILTRDPATDVVREEIFDLAKDPLEKADLARGVVGPGNVPFDDAFKQALEALRNRVAGPLTQPR